MQNHLLYTEFLFIKQRLIRLYLSSTLVFGHITTKPVTHSSAPARLLVQMTSLRAVQDMGGSQHRTRQPVIWLTQITKKHNSLWAGEKTRTQNHKNDKTANRKAQHQMARGKTRLKDSLQHKTKADTVNRWWKQQGQNRQSFRWEPKTGSKTKRKLIHQSKTGSNQNILVKEGAKN